MFIEQSKRRDQQAESKETSIKVVHYWSLCLSATLNYKCAHSYQELMVHVAMNINTDSGLVNWMERVTDEAYYNRSTHIYYPLL